MADYAAAVVPALVPGTIATAKSALSSALAGAFTSPVAAPAMESAFAEFAATMATGMGPAFAAVPPPRPVGFASQFLIPQTTHAGAAAAFSALIDSWMRAGTATPSGGGPLIFWQ